jgi:hypothetical protein
MHINFPIPATKQQVGPKLRGNTRDFNSKTSWLVSPQTPIASLLAPCLSLKTSCCHLKMLCICKLHELFPDSICCTSASVPFPALTFHGQMASNFKPCDINQWWIKLAIKKYAVKRGFKWIGSRPLHYKVGNFGELDSLSLIYVLLYHYDHSFPQCDLWHHSTPKPCDSLIPWPVWHLYRCRELTKKARK